MGKRKVSDEQIAEILRLYRKLGSYRAVGRDLGFDARTVKDKVLKAQQDRERQHWEAVSRQADGKLLQEHYQALVQVALAVQDTVRSDPLDVHPDRHAEEYLSQQFGLRLVNAPLYSPSVPRGGDAGRELRLVSLLWEDLMGHEANLAMALNGWRGTWDGLQEKRRDLIEPARHYLEQRQVNSDLTEQLAPDVVKEALDMLWHEKERLAFQENQQEQETPIVRGGSRLCTVPSGQVKIVTEAYEWTLDQLLNLARAKGVDKLFQELEKSIERIDGLIDRLLLRGRPQGPCTIFPLAGIPYLGDEEGGISGP